MQAPPDAVDVGEVHKEDLGVGVVLRALHASTSSPVEPHKPSLLVASF